MLLKIFEQKVIGMIGVYHVMYTDEVYGSLGDSGLFTESTA